MNTHQKLSKCLLSKKSHINPDTKLIIKTVYDFSKWKKNQQYYVQNKVRNGGKQTVNSNRTMNDESHVIQTKGELIFQYLICKIVLRLLSTFRQAERKFVEPQNSFMDRLLQFPHFYSVAISIEMQPNWIILVDFRVEIYI